MSSKPKLEIIINQKFPAIFHSYTFNQINPSQFFERLFEKYEKNMGMRSSSHRNKISKIGFSYLEIETVANFESGEANEKG